MSGSDHLPVVGMQYRVSSIGQVERGHSLATQLEDCRRRADELLGPEQYEEILYPDEGVSGTLAVDDLAWMTKKTRRNLSQLTADGELQKLDLVVFASVDRLARNELVFHHTLEKLRKAGVPFVFADVDVDANTDDGATTVGVLQVIAASFSRRHRRRIERAYARRRAEGYPSGCRPPYGWRWETPNEQQGKRRGFMPHEEQAPWVRFMYEQYMTGARTTTWIAEELVRRGVRRADGGTGWDAGAVRKILIHWAHCGLIPEKDGSFRDATHWQHRYWERADRERVIERLGRNKKLGSRTVNTEGWPLLGIIRCAHCGTRLRSIRPPGSRRSYHCPRTVHADGHRCEGVSKTAPPLEEIVLGEVRKIVCGDDVQSLALREAERLLKDEDERITEQVSALERQQADLDDRLSGLVEMRAGREIDAATFAEQQHRLKSRKAEVAGRVEEQRRELGERAARKVELDSVRAALADFDSVWDTLTGQQQRELLRTVVEELSLGRCDDGTGDVRLTLKLHFLPARVFQLPNLIKAPRAEGAAGLRPRELAYLAHRLDGLSDEAIGQQFGVPVDSVKRLARKIATDFANPDLGQVARLARPRIESVRPGLPMKGRMHRSVDHAAWHWTDRRVCVLDRLSRLVPRAAIASELGISRKTVDTHVCVMMAHAGVDSWQELVRCAREQGLITE